VNGEEPAQPQNIYDDERFFQGYAQLDRFGSGWETAMERSDFLALLPAVEGLRVLDLGCGLGQLSVYLAERGAAEVVGVDVSERMLALARKGRARAGRSTGTPMKGRVANTGLWRACGSTTAHWRRWSTGWSTRALWCSAWWSRCPARSGWPRGHRMSMSGGGRCSCCFEECGLARDVRARVCYGTQDNVETTHAAWRA
jgi:hypothetical protein